MSWERLGGGLYDEGLEGGRYEEIYEGGSKGGYRGGLDSLPRTTNMAAVQTTCVSADYRNFSEFYLSG